MNTTDGIYADFRKVEQGMKLYMKLSQPVHMQLLSLYNSLPGQRKKIFLIKIW